MNDKCVVLNAKKMNFDGKLDFSVLSSDVTVYDDTTEQQLSERIQGADIIVTKEMPVSAEMIQKFPESVKLICEAGDNAKEKFLKKFDSDWERYNRDLIREVQDYQKEQEDAK